MRTVDLGEAARYNPKSLPASQFAEVGKVVRLKPLAPAAHASGRQIALHIRHRLGETLMLLDMRMTELREHFGLTPEDLNLDLGPLGPLLPRD